MKVFRSRQVLKGTTIEPADIIVEHDTIVEVVGHGSAGEAIDLGSRLIVPGFVDLHSDAVEKEIEPRPGASFPMKNALVELDKKLAMSGITTMFHAIAFNEESLVGLRGTETAARLLETLFTCNRNVLAVDNFIHARYEITSFSSVTPLKEAITTGRIRLLSFMDHSPGQGQFQTLAKWKKYHMPVYDLSEVEAADIVTVQRSKRKISMDFLEDLAALARHYGVLLASHDDDTPEKIDLMASLGVTVAEFPLSGPTAKYARSRKMRTGMGAPNVVRGKSQSGNISARMLLEQDCCDFLCSDYHPSSMLQAVYAVHRNLGMDLGKAFSLITATPATIVGLDDRGMIAPGKLADLTIIEDQPIAKVVMTIKAGKPVYSSSDCLCTHAYA